MDTNDSKVLSEFMWSNTHWILVDMVILLKRILELAVAVCSQDPGTLESEAGGLLLVGKQLR